MSRHQSLSRTFSHFPGKWAICPCCDGNGGTSAHLGSFTSDEWNEMDYEFREDYIEGRYDRPCDECGGTGKVREIDVKACSFGQKRELVTWRMEEGWRQEAARERCYEARMLGEY